MTAEDQNRPNSRQQSGNAALALETCNCWRLKAITGGGELDKLGRRKLRALAHTQEVAPRKVLYHGPPKLRREQATRVGNLRNDTT